MRALLTFHSIDESGSVISMTPAQLDRVFDNLATAGVSVVSPADLLHSPKPGNLVALTFDDAFRNFREIAWPQLRARRWPAALFVPVDQLGTTNCWNGVSTKGIPELPLCTVEDLRSLVAEGCEIGAHGRRHRRLAGLSDSDLDDETAGAKTSLETLLGIEVSQFVYPFGSVDPRAVDAVRRHYSVAMTTEFDWFHGVLDPHVLPRLDTFYFRSNDHLASFGSSSFTRFVRRRAWLRRVRRFFAPTSSAG